MGLMNEMEVGFRLVATDNVSGAVNRARSSLLSLGSTGTSTASSVSSGFGKMGAGALTAARNIALVAIPVVAALGAIAVSSTNAAKTFQADMTLIQTQAGATAGEVTNMSAAVLKLAPQVGVGPEELATGLYHVESAGLRGAKALDVLTVAAEGAKVGHADLESVTNALVAANQSGVKGVEDMAGAMGSLNAIVGAGNMRMQDLTDAMGTGVLSTAKNYGVTLQSVGAALADMTDQGIPATDAATRLNSAMRLMAAPTSKAISELKSIGLSQTALATDMRGPGGIDAAIQDLKAHLDKSGLSLTQQAALIASAFGGKQSGAILTLIGNVDLLDQKVAAVNEGAGQFGAAWEATGLTVAEEQAKLSASISSLKIQLGTELLPVEQRVFKGLADIAGSPAVQSGIVDLGKAIDGLFSEQNVASAEKFVEGVIPAMESFANGVLPPLIASLKVAGAITKEAFDLFNSLPGPLKAAVIGSLAVNKLSGGLIGSGVMDVIQGVAQKATGASGGAGVVASVLGVQKVFVINMPPGGMGGGLPGAGGAATGEEAAGAAAGGIGLGTIALVAGAVLTTGFAAYLASQLPGQIDDQNKAAADQQQAWMNTDTTPQQNIDALQGSMKSYKDLMSNPLNNIAADIPGTGIGSTEGQGLKDAASKIANGVSITPEGVQAIKDAITFAQGSDQSGLQDAVPQLQEYLKQANLLLADQIGRGGKPAPTTPKPTVLSAEDKANINHAANTAHSDVMSQLRGNLDAKKAITDGTAIARVYGTGTATDMKFAQKNIKELTAVQQAFAAAGDVTTAGALGADIQTLKDALAGQLDDVVAAINANPTNTNPSNKQTRYAPDAPEPPAANPTPAPAGPTPAPRSGKMFAAGGNAYPGDSGTVGEGGTEDFALSPRGVLTIRPRGSAAPTSIRVNITNQIPVADVNKAVNTRTYYSPGTPQ